MARSPLDRRRRRSGQSLVEFALVVPIIVLLFAGIVDLGRAFYYQIGVTDAAREGARVLSGNNQGNGPGLPAVCTALARDLVDAGGVASCSQVGHPPPYASGADYTPPAPGQAIALVYCGSGSQPGNGTPCVNALRTGCGSLSACPNQVAIYVYYGFPLFTAAIDSLAGAAIIQLQAGAQMVTAW